MQSKDLLDPYILHYILLGTGLGFFGRWWLLRGDIRQYPSIPNGYFIHLTTGFVAAAIGSVAYPALIFKNFTAVTFLTLAIQQFRDIRKTEKTALESIETENYFPRGRTYIDGIAKTFESRNYIVMIAAATTTILAFNLKSVTSSHTLNCLLAVIGGCLILYVLKHITKGHILYDIITVEETPISFSKNHDLMVGDTFVMNVGLPATRQRILDNGVGFTLRLKNPDNEKHKVILNHLGQRKAILHECSRVLGLERYCGTRRNFDTGDVVLMIVPIIKDKSRLEQVIYHVPILEMDKVGEHK